MQWIILDADGLIKLGKIGLLALLAKEFNCIISTKVFEEAVKEGKKGLYQDAFIIEEYINQGIIQVVPAKKDPQAQRILAKVESLGEGEKSSLHLFYSQKAEAVVSDDATFLNLLDKNNIPFLTPANLISGLVEAGRLSKKEGLRLLEELKPFIKDSVYELVKKQIEGG